MKKIFIIAMTAAAMISCGSASKYTITGTSEEFADGKWAFLTIEEGRELKNIDSMAITGNSFKFVGEVENPYSAYVIIKDAEADRPELYAEIYVEPGTIEVKKLDPEYQAYSAVGTPLNDLTSEMNAKMAELMKDENASNEDIMKLYADFIMANAANLAGQNMLKQNYYMLAPQQVLDAIAAIPAEKQEEFADMKNAAEQALKVEPGNAYIDVVEPTPDGKELSLKSVVENKKNKYVLLDFWASWCGPCMAEVPYLVETYKNYNKKGFEIFGVSFDRNRDAWLKAIKEKELSWLHVSNVKYWDTPSRHAYAVNSIPANFLIDCSTGKIIAKGLRGEELQKKIAELLK